MKFIENLLCEFIRSLNGFTHNYGLAIILLTILIRIALIPLGIKQDRAMKKMKEIQPELKKLQKKYKGDKQGLQKAQMEFYKREKVNPLASCLPIIVQLPIFWALFVVLKNTGADAVIPTNAKFLFWVLSKPDKTLILPVLNGITMFIQQKFTMATDMGNSSNMKMLTYGMPVMITVISINFPSGLLLYWTTSTIGAALQYYVVTSNWSKSQSKKS